MRKSKSNIQKTTERSASTTIKQKLTKRKVPNTTHEEMKCSHILLPPKSTTKQLYNISNFFLTRCNISRFFPSRKMVNARPNAPGSPSYMAGMKQFTKQIIHIADKNYTRDHQFLMSFKH